MAYGYPTVKKFEEIFICFDATHERDGHTQTPHADTGHAYASHRAAKNGPLRLILHNFTNSQYSLIIFGTGTPYSILSSLS